MLRHPGRRLALAAVFVVTTALVVPAAGLAAPTWRTLKHGHVAGYHIPIMVTRAQVYPGLLRLRTQAPAGTTLRVNWDIQCQQGSLVHRHHGIWTARSGIRKKPLPKGFVGTATCSITAGFEPRGNRARSSYALQEHN